MGTHKIRTTIKPGAVLTVDDAELLDLTRQGLILPPKKKDTTEDTGDEPEKGA